MPLPDHLLTSSSVSGYYFVNLSKVYVKLHINTSLPAVTLLTIVEVDDGRNRFDIVFLFYFWLRLNVNAVQLCSANAP